MNIIVRLDKIYIKKIDFDFQVVKITKKHPDNLNVWFNKYLGQYIIVRPGSYRMSSKEKKFKIPVLPKDDFRATRVIDTIYCEVVDNYTKPINYDYYLEVKDIPYSEFNHLRIKEMELIG